MTLVHICKPILGTDRFYKEESTKVDHIGYARACLVCSSVDTHIHSVTHATFTEAQGGRGEQERHREGEVNRRHREGEVNRGGTGRER